MNQLDLRVGEGLAQQLLTVVRIVDGEILVQANQGGILPQQAGAEPVKRAHPHAAARRQAIQPQPHLVGRLVRERQRHDLLVRNPLFSQIRHAMRHHARLARAGPRQDQQRSVHVLDRLSLRIGE